MISFLSSDGTDVCINRCGFTVSNPLKEDQPAPKQSAPPGPAPFIINSLQSSGFEFFYSRLSTPRTVTTSHPTGGTTALSGPAGYHGESVRHLFQIKDEGPSSPITQGQRATTSHVHTQSNVSLQMLTLCNCVDRRDQFE